MNLFHSKRLLDMTHWYVLKPPYCYVSLERSLIAPVDINDVVIDVTDVVDIGDIDRNRFCR